MDLHRLGRIDVLGGHEPARLVGTDWQQRQIEAAASVESLTLGQAFTEILEIPRVPGVTCEEQMAIVRKNGEATPERLHSIGQASTRPVLGGAKHDLNGMRGGAQRVGLPPIELYHGGDATRADL